MDKISAAVIGCGRMGAFTSESVKRYAPEFYFPLSHMEAIKAHPRLELRAAADTDEKALNKASDSYLVPKRYTDSAKMLEEVQPKLIGVATRTIGRAEIVALAIKSGTQALHIEKPLCNSPRELDFLRQELAKPDVFVTYGAIRRFFNVYKFAREIANSGEHGQLKEIRVNLGSASLYWTHPHSIDLILFFAGGRKIVGVQARFSDMKVGNFTTEILSDPRVVSASIYFDDGLAAHITQGLGADIVLSCGDSEITVRADGASVDIYSSDNGQAYPSLKALPYPKNIEEGGTLAPVSHLVRCLEGSVTEIEMNTEIKLAMLTGQAIAFAMIQSHLEGSRIVEIDSYDQAMFIHAKASSGYA
jgi:scyllo-inositol 2-dehydrogenase (NAD+)